MKRVFLLILISTICFTQTEEWIYFNYVPMECSYWYCVPAGESVNRIKPDGTENEIILENVQFSELSIDQTKFLYIDHENETLHIYNTETMDTTDTVFEPFIDIQKARFIHDENVILLSGIGVTGSELYSYSILDSSTTMIADSLSSYFDNMEMSPDEQQVLYFRESHDQPEDVSGCDLPENTLYLTDLDGSTGSYTGEVFYNSSSEIGGFQFHGMGPPTGCGAGGGDAEDAGFTVECQAGNIVVGSSSTGSTIPAGCGTLTNLSFYNSADGLDNIVMLDSVGDTLDFNYYDGYLNTDDYSMNVDIIIEDLQSGETSILGTILQLINSGDGFYAPLIYNQPYWSDNGFIYLFFFDNSECMQLFKIHSTDGSITQLTDNPCSSHCPSSILETNQTDLEKLVYAAYNDSLLNNEYWIYDIESNESSYLGYFGDDNYISRPMSQAWSPDQSKVAFNEMLFFGFPFSGPLRIYDTVTDSIAMLELHNGWSHSAAASRIVWVTSNIEEGCNADEVELWGECYSIEHTTELDLSYIGISGEIPPEIGNLINLSSLILKENQLSGEIPTEISYMMDLTQLDLGGNQLSGEIPPEIGSLTNLNILDLAGNQLSGALPPEIGNLANLTELELGGNQLTGAIPSEIGNLESLTFIHLEYNQFTGEIPPEIGNLANLVWLNFVHNQLTGEIPSSICNLDLNWSDPNNFNISENQLCPLYPGCIEEYVGDQDTTNCVQVSILDETFPLIYKLHSAYPNPFNPVTTLNYDLPENEMVNIAIYDMMGRIVKTLVKSSQTAGYKSIRWNATDDRNEPVSAGVYLYTIQAGEFRQTRKLVLLK